MTLDEARQRRNARVVYDPRRKDAEKRYGTIDRVGGTYVFVRFEGSPVASAAAPEFLSIAPFGDSW